MIRILHIVHALTRGGGLSNFIMNYYRTIDRNQIQFDFIYFRESESDFKEEILSLGGRYYKWTEPGLNLRYRKDADAFFKAHQGEYTAVHCHALFALAFYAGIARKYGVPNIIAHSHSVGYGNSGFLRKLRNRFFVYECKHKADYKLACSNAAAKFMFGEKAFNDNEVLVIENAVNCDKYFFDRRVREEVRKEFSITDQFVIGHVGGFAEQKNHGFLVELFYEFQKAHPNSLLLLVGGSGIAAGSTLPDIKRKVNELGLDKKILFTGIRKDVNRLMMGMDVFLFPSKNEGFGLVLVEAQASGLKCLASTNVPRDAKCTDNVKFLTLNRIGDWLVELTNIQLEQNSKQVSRLLDPSQFNKYNVKYNAVHLEQLYNNLKF